MHRQDESGTRRKRCGAREGRGEGHLKLRWEGSSNRVPKGCQWAWGFQVQLELEAGGCDPGILPELGEELVLSSSRSMLFNNGLNNSRQAEISFTMFPALVFNALQ